MPVAENTPKTNMRTAVAIGDFDGVHKGHAAIIEKLKETAKSKGLKPVIYTFDSCSKGRKNIYSLKKKLSVMADMGIDCVTVASFEDIKDISALNFAENILKDKLSADCVVGGSIRFGKNALGNELLLEKAGIDTVAVEPVYLCGEMVSSTKIRALIESGDMKKASELLGRAYDIEGEVKYGHQNGRKLGFPTANLHFGKDLVIPALGVYAAFVYIGANKYRGICNVGIHPTVGSESDPVAEVNIFGFDGDLYGSRICVEPVSYLRREKKFADINSLISQIESDITEAHSALDSEERQ